jgi:hypothetical protein
MGNFNWQTQGGTQARTLNITVFTALLLGFNLAWVYSTRIVLPNSEMRIELENAILNGVAESPWQYRFFVPTIANNLGGLFESTGLTATQVHQLSHFILDGFAASVILVLSTQLAGFTRQAHAVLLQLVIYAGLNIALYDHGYAPWSMVEIALWLLALFVLKVRRPWALVLILPAMALVRETGLLLGLAVTLLIAMESNGWIPALKKMVPALFGMGLAILVQFAIRLSIGPRPEDITPSEVMLINFSATGIRQVVFNLILLFALPLLFTWARPSSARIDLGWERKVVISLSPYLAAVIIGAIWYEVRLLAILLPILAIGSVRILIRADEG